MKKKGDTMRLPLDHILPDLGFSKVAQEECSGALKSVPVTPGETKIKEAG
jgi:hypothetical protein